MATLNPYLSFNGNCEEAFEFYKSVFGGEFAALQRFKDVPPQENMPMPEDEGEKIMHVALPVGQHTVLMGSDSPESMGKVEAGSNISISVQVEREEEAEKIFNGLTEGGNTTMPLAKTFWNAYFGMCTDKFGIQWMVNYDYNQNKK